MPEDRLPKGAAKRDASEGLSTAYGKDEWVQVPDTNMAETGVKKYGRLAGLWVPGPVWNDVRQTMNYKPIGGEFYSNLLKAWKVSKTALSPAVHMNNVMANVIMADWHDVGVMDVARALRVMMEAHRRGAEARGR
jgi:hypothetical protein